MSNGWVKDNIQAEGMQLGEKVARFYVLRLFVLQAGSASEGSLMGLRSRFRLVMKTSKNHCTTRAEIFAFVTHFGLRGDPSQHKIFIDY